jgi:hypothetical protein
VFIYGGILYFMKTKRKKKTKIKKDPLNLDPRKWGKMCKRLGLEQVDF